MNNNQIDNTDYYLLPSGKYLEDFIWHKKLSFAHGCALKYVWRAGKKDGESRSKDHDKYGHYIHFIAKETGVDVIDVAYEILNLKEEAERWGFE